MDRAVDRLFKCVEAFPNAVFIVIKSEVERNKGKNENAQRVGGVKEISNWQDGAEFDLLTMAGEYYDKPCCRWRNQVGRSQSGDGHISVGDEVKACLQAAIFTHTNIWH